MSTNIVNGNSTDKYNSIDLTKFIMALFVVAIHTNPWVNCSNENILNKYMVWLLQLAVPFFFLASGYLLSTGMTSEFRSERDILRIKYQLSKIIRMYFTWTIIYFPLAVYHYISSKTALDEAVLLYIRGVLFVGQNYNSQPLWYLLSMIYSMVVIILILKLPRTNRNLLITSIIFSIIYIGFSMLVIYEGGGNCRQP